MLEVCADSVKEGDAGQAPKLTLKVLQQEGVFQVVKIGWIVFAGIYPVRTRYCQSGRPIAVPVRPSNYYNHTFFIRLDHSAMLIVVR
jgi:hypothetical protein